MTKIAVLGAGIMASGLTFPATDNGHDVNLIGTFLDDEIIDSIKNDGTHPMLGLKLSDKVTPFHFSEVEEGFKDAEIVMVGVNSFGIDWMGEQLKKYLKPGTKVIVITKGMQADDDGTLHVLPHVLQKAVGDLADQVTWTAIVGPCIAGELAVRRQSCVVFAGLDQDANKSLAETYRTDYYHVWTSTDFVGHETGAATKNIYAFAAGFAQGLLKKQGEENAKYVMHNYTAALFGQGSVEMHDFIELLGGDPKTADGLAGVGDCYVTSAGGRNVKAGGFVGQGIPFSEVVSNQMKGITLEGVAAIRVVGEALEKLTASGKVPADKFPLCRFLYDVIAKDAPLDVPWSKLYGGEK